MSNISESENVLTPDITSTLSAAIVILDAAEVPNPAVDAQILLAEVLGVGRGELQAAQIRGQKLDTEAIKKFQTFVNRRSKREPLQHILGEASFRKLSLRVGPGVFVPRPETELLVEHALRSLHSITGGDSVKTIPDTSSPVVFDIGTGSGAIALSIASEYPQAQVFALEKSAEAHQWAAQNFERLNLPNATLILGEVGAHARSEVTNLFERYSGRVSVLVSNPPYIPVAAIPRDIEVKKYDPELALYGGEDGLDIIRMLSTLGQQLLHSGGQLIMEHGESQHADIAAILEADNWVSISCEHDLTRRERFTLSTKL